MSRSPYNERVLARMREETPALAERAERLLEIVERNQEEAARERHFRYNVGFTCTPSAGERVLAQLREGPVSDIVVRIYAVDEKGRPVWPRK